MLRAVTSTGGGRDLDSEGANERSRFYRRRASGIRTQTQLGARCRHLITRNDNRMARALVRHAAPCVLSNEDGAAERHRSAVVTPRHAWRCAGVLLMAAGSCGLGWVAPHLAQKHGVLTHAHHQHDRKNSCSTHLKLAIQGARAAPTPNRVYCPEPSASHLLCQFALTDLRDFADEVPKIPQVRLAVFNEALRGFSRNRVRSSAHPEDSQPQPTHRSDRRSGSK